MLETYWSSELSQLQELQRREYREWVTKVHEDVIRANSGGWKIETKRERGRWWMLAGLKPTKEKIGRMRENC